MSEETGIMLPENPLAAMTEANPALLKRRATDVAGVARDIVMKCTMAIQGKQYVKVEGWQAIANLYGCVGTAGPVEKVEGGWVSMGSVVHVATGRVMATGEGFVGEDEPMWMKRPLYARRAMAQTRAISRACRAAFAFVVPMIDARLQTTPAEEMYDTSLSSAPESEPVHQGEVVHTELETDPVTQAVAKWKAATTPTARARALIGLTKEQTKLVEQLGGAA